MRSRFFFHEQKPLHIIGKTQRTHWPLSMPEAWGIFCETIHDLQDEYPITTHSFVLMRNHYHWICSFDLVDDPLFFQWFHECLNVSFLGAFLPDEDLYTLEHEPLILHLEQFPFFKETYRYVYANPVTAGIVADALDYPYSTLAFALGKREPPFQIVDNMNLIIDPIRTISWINCGSESDCSKAPVKSQMS